MKTAALETPWNILEHTWDILEHPRRTGNTNGTPRNTLETPGTTKPLKWSIVSGQTAD